LCEQMRESCGLRMASKSENERLRWAEDRIILTGCIGVVHSEWVSWSEIAF
jgi:hypothetical protein